MVLASVFGDRDGIKVTSDVLPGVTRSFGSYSAAASEAGLSRLYGGVHTRLDHQAGLELAGLVLKRSASPAFGLGQS